MQKLHSVSFTGKNIPVSENAVDVSASNFSEAMEALMVLGYSQGEIAPLLRKCDTTLSTQEIIREVLRLITAGNI